MDHIDAAPAKSSRTEFSPAAVFRGLGVILGVTLALDGQLVLLRKLGTRYTEGQMQVIAGSMLVLGAFLFGALGNARLNFVPRLEIPLVYENQSAPPPGNRWKLAWIGVAILLSLVSIMSFATTEETPSVVLLWLCSILALCIAQVRSIQIAIPGIPPQERIYLTGLLIALVVALVSRVHNLTILPYNVDGDFASVGLQARALATGQQQQIFTYGWAKMPMLGYLLPWFTMTIFGTGLAGLNASGVIQSLPIIAGVYLLGRDLFHPRAGLLAAALLTISYTHIAASRQSTYIDPVFFLVFALYFLFVGLREARGWATTISGILTALCIQMYFSGRLIVFIVAFILLYLLLFRRQWLWERRWILLLWILAFIITLGPMIVVFVREFDAFMDRTRLVNIFNPDVSNHMLHKYQVNSFPELLIQQARRSLFLFHYYVDTGTQFGLRQPFLDPFTAVLFVLGGGYALLRWRSFGYAIILAWCILGVVLGSFLAGDPPYWTRLMVLLPPTALLAAIALDRLYELAEIGLMRIFRPARLVAPLVMVMLLISVGIQNWNIYVAVEGDFGTPRTLIGRYLADQPASTSAYIVSSQLRYNDRELEFLAPGRFIGNLTPEQLEEDIPTYGTPVLLILTPEQNVLLPRLQEKFPGEPIEAIAGNSPPEIAFYVFRLP